MKKRKSKASAEPDFELSNWAFAMYAYERGDRYDLLEMLRSKVPITPTAREYLADLLDRLPKLRRGWKSKTTPAHKMSDSNELLFWATRDVRNLVRSGMRVHKAVEQVARQSNIEENTLDSAYYGRHSGLRRDLKRHPRYSKI